MKAHQFRFTAIAIVCSFAFACSAQAETDQVTLARQFGIGYLPLAVMQNKGLVKKHLEAEGLKDTKVSWMRFGTGSAANDALLSGQLNFAAGGTGPAIILWDRTRSSVDVRGVAALSSMPNMLVTADPRIKTIQDLTNKDRIAMAGAGSSVQTVYLQMAVSKIWGIKNYKKLNPLMVNLPHPEGLRAVLSGSGEIRSTFTSPPFQYMALDHPGVKVVLNSYDVMGGPNTFLMVWATDKFRTANPKTYKAVLGALKEATAWINDNKHAAAQLYVEDVGDKSDVQAIEKMIRDPQIQYKIAPDRILPYAQFMHKVGSIKHDPKSWKDLFFPEIHDLAGS
ncbi:ABC transporter substrate-binding protein [uncultured Castellaniella sp.]|uniref:ABC transporter substrate-binding protein n=1 Tax=uncultured Castellaniella sp. TaxID=647907 RepID=UPI002606C2B3|nr:ABC transporter substrate-binding protein [uncultured Castellaniella sp.]